MSLDQLLDRYQNILKRKVKFLHLFSEHLIIDWQIRYADDDIVDGNTKVNVMDNNVCPVSVGPWQPNYLPADLSDVSRYPLAVSGESEPRQATQDCNQRNHFPRHLGHNLPTEVQSPDNSDNSFRECLAVLTFTCLPTLIKMITTNVSGHRGRGGVCL